MKKVILVFIAIFLFTWSGQAQKDLEAKYRTEAQIYFNGQNSLSLMLDRLLPIVARSADSIQITQIKADVLPKANELLFETFLPVYKKHFSLEELMAINKFYRTPAGRKLMNTEASILKESSEKAQAWSETLLQLITESMKMKDEVQP